MEAGGTLSQNTALVFSSMSRAMSSGLSESANEALLDRIQARQLRV